MSDASPNPVLGVDASESLTEVKPLPQSTPSRRPANPIFTTVPRTSPPQVGPTRVPRWTYVWSLAGIGIAGMWAFMPLEDGADLVGTTATTPVPTSRVTGAQSPTTLSALDLDAFRAPIWLLPPEPPPPPPELPPLLPAPPLRLQLLAITSESPPEPGKPAVLRATLYDPDTDRLLIVASGEKIGDRTVERITPKEVALAGADGKRTLSLADVQPSSSNGGRR